MEVAEGPRWAMVELVVVKHSRAGPDDFDHGLVDRVLIRWSKVPHGFSTWMGCARVVDFAGWPLDVEFGRA